MFQRWTEREAQLIQVIQKNTEAWARMTTVLEVNNKNCAECKQEQLDLWKEAICKMDEALVILKKEEN
jgi:hypothetical protein